MSQKEHHEILVNASWLRRRCSQRLKVTTIKLSLIASFIQIPCDSPSGLHGGAQGCVGVIPHSDLHPIPCLDTTLPIQAPHARRQVGMRAPTGPCIVTSIRLYHGQVVFTAELLVISLRSSSWTCFRYCCCLHVVRRHIEGIDIGTHQLS